jgi:hypothetical protein
MALATSSISSVFEHHDIGVASTKKVLAYDTALALAHWPSRIALNTAEGIPSLVDEGMKHRDESIAQPVPT